jgi:hypothetical protein
MAKTAFGKCGALSLNGKTISSKATLTEAGIKTGSQVTTALGGGVKYKEKRD